jgi:conjugal transfer pilus assembly protein TraB
MQPQLVGGISMVEGISPQKVSDKDTKKKNTIFLPPSFMKADLLVGIDAMASSAGSSNPETIVFRVNAPAVLPNELKANLSGCFVVADAFGNLAKERIQVRLQSLECLGINGHSVISETVKGFAADEDGKRDLAGIVVSRAGTNLARAAFASAIEGFGEVAAESATTSSISPLGTTQVLNTDEAVKAGLGKGIAGGASEVSKYLMELVRQTVPVIEVGAAKKVTLFIQEAVELEIRETGNEKI